MNIWAISNVGYSSGEQILIWFRQQILISYALCCGRFFFLPLISLSLCHDSSRAGWMNTSWMGYVTVLARKQLLVVAPKEVWSLIVRYNSIQYLHIHFRTRFCRWWSLKHLKFTVENVWLEFFFWNTWLALYIYIHAGMQSLSVVVIKTLWIYAGKYLTGVFQQEHLVSTVSVYSLLTIDLKRSTPSFYCIYIVNVFL